jgi:hypothetical protein
MFFFILLRGHPNSNLQSCQILSYSFDGLGPLVCSHLELIWKCIHLVDISAHYFKSTIFLGQYRKRGQTSLFGEGLEPCIPVCRRFKSVCTLHWTVLWIGSCIQDAVLSNFIIDWSIKKKVPVGYFYVTTRSPCYFTQVSICGVGGGCSSLSLARKILPVKVVKYLQIIYTNRKNLLFHY